MVLHPTYFLTLGVCRRYRLTVGSSAIQNRHGMSCARDTPVRGPLRTRPGGGGVPAVSRTGDNGSHTSTPSNTRVIPNASANRPGPCANSLDERAAGRRPTATSPPATISPARTSTPCDSPSQPHTMFAA